MNYLYLCSSIRHAYLAMGIANDAPEANHHLIFINQKNAKDNHTVQLFLKDKRPFASIEVYENGKGVIGKYQSKRAAFTQLKAALQRLQPHKIFGGNDRRTEFQFAMHFCHQLKKSKLVDYTPTGIYMDDGTGSYVNGVYLNKLQTITDLTIDRALKKLFYGLWYDKSMLMGGSKWVDECWLTFPDLAPENLNKTIVPLKPATFRSKSFLSLAERYLPTTKQASDSDGRDDIFSKKYDAFLILPYSKFVKTYFPSSEVYVELANKYLEKFDNIAVKYHPREKDFYFKSSANITEFPPSIPAEVIFSFVSANCVVGDLSSALLSANWLLPESESILLCPEKLADHTLIQIFKRTPISIEYYA